MPNWVTNELTLKGDHKLLVKIAEAVKDDDADNAFSLSKIDPIPRTMNIMAGGVSDDALIISAYEKYGKNISAKLAQEIDKFGFAGICVADGEKLTIDEERLKEEYIKAIKRFKNGHESEDKDYMIGCKGRAPESPKTLADARWLGNLMLNNINEYGAKDWYDWCCENWGTKWEVDDDDMNWQSDTELCYSFNTAWSTPAGALETLTKRFPEVNLECRYADEDFGSNVGIIYYENGEYTEYVPGTYKDAQELAADILGYDLNEDFTYDAENDCYEWKD